ncbi:SagB family peptide dehydrogenase [Pseudalkalibacillus sp. R45]|uniref:SagB family peptide dehydrogenase n=1 Tax=Pseudalkalibacillus sp. R45 TaxID=3457433 RepID=UPI003FCE0EC8
MDLDEFLYNLHYDIDRIKPPDLEIDWDDAPLPYKLYQDQPVIPLSSDIPHSFEELDSALTLENMSAFLWYVYGLVQFSEDTMNLARSRRFVPSGGGLYPNELYLYLKIEDLAEGIYHYDVAHHRLVLLREGNFDEYFNHALGGRCDLSDFFGVAFISTMFWKNFFKYNNFAYRLQGLDAGALIGQLCEVSKRFGYSHHVCFQFLDRVVNHLLGLDEQEESVYAIVPLAESEGVWSNEGNGSKQDESLPALPKLDIKHYVRSEKVLDYTMLVKMNEASMMESTETSNWVRGEENGEEEGLVIWLPTPELPDVDFSKACLNRYSPEMDFTLEKITQQQLAVLLKEATKTSEGGIEIYGCFYNVEGVPYGAYRYDPSSHTLRLIRPGDMRVQLQSAMTMHNVNLYQVPLCFHLVGVSDPHKKGLGYRGYRIQQMEAGMMMQRLLLASSALGLGGHPLLGFDVASADDIYRFENESSLIQIPIGPYQPRPWLKGMLI